MKRTVIALAGAGLAIALAPNSASALTAGEAFGAALGGVLNAVVGGSQPQPASGYQDLIGVRASSADSALRQRGYQDRGGFKTSDTSFVYWTQVNTGQCILVATSNGSIAKITNESPSSCNQAGSGNVAQQPSYPPAVRPAPTTYTTFRPDGSGLDCKN
jgi:hypothetical protein